MPEKRTLKRAAEDKRKGKAPTTQAGEFVREEMEHVKQGKHGVASRKQAIAIGLSKARRAGVDLKPPKKGKASEATRKKAERDYGRGHKKTASGSSSSHQTAKKSAPAKRKSTTKKSSTAKRKGTAARR